MLNFPLDAMRFKYQASRNSTVGNGKEMSSNSKRFPHISGFKSVRQSYDWVLPWGVSTFRGPSYLVAQDIVHALAIFPDDIDDERRKESGATASLMKPVSRDLHRPSPFWRSFPFLPSPYLTSKLYLQVLCIRKCLNSISQSHISC